MKKVKGIGAAKGYASGAAVIKRERRGQPPERRTGVPEAELEKFKVAQSRYREKLKDLYQQTKNTLGEKDAAIFKAYEAILEDKVFFQGILKRVEREKVNIEHVIWEEKNKVAQAFRSMKDPYLQERGIDIENVCNQLIALISGEEEEDLADAMAREIIVVASDLTPEDTVRIDKARLKAFITEKGGVTSHTVILAKSLGIPAIVGAVGILETVRANEILLVDGNQGEIVVQPDEATLAGFIEGKARAAQQQELFHQSLKERAVTLDGQALLIEMNAGDAASMEAFDPEICDGIGLFRTEFLYMNHQDYPSEEAQFEVYKRIAEKGAGKEVVIRTLDIGGDKQLDYMDLPKEANPFLGYRAIRICLDRREMFLTQLRAILRASAYGHVKIMFPMIVNVEELRSAKSAVKEAMAQLDERQAPYDQEIQMGIMIETPAAVLMSDKLAIESDFFSIGSNDLIQYVTATDRMNERVQYLYDSCNLAVLRAIGLTVENARRAGIPVSICGEAAAETLLLPLWVAMGIDKLSMVSTQIGQVKYLIRGMGAKELEGLVTEVLAKSSIDEVKEILSRY